MTMRRTTQRLASLVFGAAWILAACDGSTGTDIAGAPAAPTGNSPTNGFPSDSPPDASAGGGMDAGNQQSDGQTLQPDTSVVDAGLVGQLLALTTSCNVASTGKFKTGNSSSATVDICKLNGAFFWNAAMQIDCDGQSTTQCNASTDPNFDNQTSFTQSNGDPLAAEKLSYLVIPLPSSRFNYRNSGIHPGAVGIVIANGSYRYGVFGDESSSDSIGWASYAMAKGLGLDPTPGTGGASGGVTYILFTGSGAVVAPIEDHTAANTLGAQLTTTLLLNN